MPDNAPAGGSPGYVMRVAGLVQRSAAQLRRPASHPRAALAARRLGRQSILLVATGGLAITAAGVFFALVHTALWQACVMMGLLGIGFGFTFAAIPGLITSAVPAGEIGSAMGFYQVVRSIGFSAGSALVASILASHEVAGWWRRGDTLNTSATAPVRSAMPSGQRTASQAVRHGDPESNQCAPMPTTPRYSSMSTPALHIRPAAREYLRAAGRSLSIP